LPICCPYERDAEDAGQMFQFAHAELERRVACYTLPFKVVQRAKMILYAADGLGNAGTPPVLGLGCGG